MEETRARLLLALALSLALALVAPGIAVGTVTIDQEALSTIPQRNSGVPILSGGHVAFDGVYRWDPTVIEPVIDVWDIGTDASVWTQGQADLEDFEGDWVAYRFGGVGEHIYVYNLESKVSWTIADTIEVSAFIGRVDIQGGLAYWLEGGGPYKTLKSIDLATGQVKEVAPLPRAIGMTITGTKVVYTRTFVADWDIWMYDMASNETTFFAVAAGPQEVIDSKDGEVLYSDEGALYVKSVSGGDAKLISDTYYNSASIGDRFIAWTEAITLADTNVHLYDRASGLEIELAGTSDMEQDPDTEGGRVAYRKWAADSGIGARMIIADVDVTEPSIRKLKAPTHLKVNNEGKFAVQIVNPDQEDANEVVWDWGDGTTTETTLTGEGDVKSTHTYSSAGTFNGTVTVTDAIGLKSERRFSVVVK